MAEESLLHEVVGLLPQQNSENGIKFPVVLSPNPKIAKTVQLTEAIKANKPYIDSLLHRSGAVLFRGFPVSSASDFNDVVVSSGYEDFSYGVGGAGSRSKVIDRVYTANEAPPDQIIPFHHEMAHAPVYPSKLFFFCEVEPGSGGETCIALSHVIYEKMQQKHPKFVEEMEEKGLIYARVLGEESDPSSPVGRSWKETFMTDDKSVAEERVLQTSSKMATGIFFQEVELPEQKSNGEGVLFPVILYPNPNTETKPNLDLFEQAIRDHKPWLESLLIERGVILFRGFPVTSPSDFNDIVQAFGFPEAMYLGGRAPRTKVVGRVYTSNESPPDIRIPFHHEMAYIPDFPSKLFFFCEEEPGKGGETPIVLSHIIYEKMKDKHPDFVSKLEEHRLTYIKVISDEERPSSFTGRSWKSTYMTHDRNVAEERAAKLGTKLEWIGNNVKLITGPLPAIRFDKESQHKTWFNNLVMSKSAPINGNIHNHDTFVELGNGDLVPDEAIKDCLKIMEEECVAIPWRKYDVMLVNNLTVLHSRKPLLKPPRSILASLCK